MASATVTLSLDSSSVTEWIAELERLLKAIGKKRLTKSIAKRLDRFLHDAVPGSGKIFDKWFCLKRSRASGASKCVVPLEPTERALKLLAALRTLKVHLDG